MSRLSAEERGETAVIVTSCGCYLVSRDEQIVKIWDECYGGEHYQTEFSVTTTSKDPQRAQVFDSAREARERLRWHRPNVLSGRDLNSYECKVCGTDEAKLGVLSARVDEDTQLALDLGATEAAE